MHVYRFSQGWRNNSLGEMLAVYVCEPKFRFSVPIEDAILPELGRQRQDDLWTPVSKNKIGIWLGR